MSLRRKIASPDQMAAILVGAMESGLAGKSLPASEVEHTQEQLLLVNTVYDKARNMRGPARTARLVK